MSSACLRSVCAEAGLLFIVAAWAAPGGAAAQEPWLLSAEADAAQPVGDPQGRTFGTGGTVAAGVYRGVTPWLLLGVRLRAGLLSAGESPDRYGVASTGAGGFATATLAARLRPLARGDDPRRGTGPFVELGGSGVLTGDLVRGGLELGLGWGFEWGAVDVTPTLRYAQVLQPDDSLDGRDARLLFMGVEVMFLDPRRPPPPPPPPPSDRDGDGIVDSEDGCPDDPEDRDGFEDEDGCPDPDNDQDGVLDPDDACPLEPEDRDGFEDEDGCPDPDNDQDAILDVDDQCPVEAEVVNGVDDQDGCPDEGLIEFVDDRIVLDARVLFDTERARVKSRASPILDAIINLWRQHPEWRHVRIEGHADYRGPDQYNQDLSEHRARNVVAGLVERGMPGDMLEAVGYGSTRPFAEGSSERSLSLNRRVEFVVTSRRPVDQAQGDRGDVESAGEAPASGASEGSE